MKFSFVVPVYNVKEYLDRCIGSILLQSCDDFEIILVDDGSSDGSSELCDQWAARNSKIEVRHQENSGVSAARNAGVNLARGEYVCFVDSDDVVEPNYLDVLRKLCGDGADVVQFGFCRVTKDKTISNPLDGYKGVSAERFFSSRNYCHAVWAYSFRLELLRANSIKFTEGLKFSEDQEFLLKVFMCADVFSCDPSVLYRYLDRVDSAVNETITKERCLSQLSAARNVLKFRKDSERVLVSGISREVSKLVDDFIYYSTKCNVVERAFVRNELDLFMSCAMGYGWKPPFFQEHAGAYLRAYEILISLKKTLFWKVLWLKRRLHKAEGGFVV